MLENVWHKISKRMDSTKNSLRRQGLVSALITDSRDLAGVAGSKVVTRYSM